MNILILERSEGHYSALVLIWTMHAQLALEDTDDEMEAFSAFASV